MGYVDLKCYFEKDTMDSNHVFFCSEQLICLFMAPGTTEKKKKKKLPYDNTARMAKYHIRSACCVRFVQMCTNNKLV